MIEKVMLKGTILDGVVEIILENPLEGL